MMPVFMGLAVQPNDAHAPEIFTAYGPCGAIEPVYRSYISRRDQRAVATRAAIPHKRTKPSTCVEVRCRLSKIWRPGLLAATVSTFPPMESRAVSIRGMMENCEYAVSNIINRTSTDW